MAGYWRRKFGRENQEFFVVFFWLDLPVRYPCEDVK